MSLNDLQRSYYGVGVDYRSESPHLRHGALHDALTGVVLEVLRNVETRGLTPTLLDIGAGHGTMTEPILARGYRVTATELSAPSTHELARRYARNDHLRIVHDPDGSLAVLAGQRFSVVLCSSLLHHIPDYLGYLRDVLPQVLIAGGSLVTVQDPLQYTTMSSIAHHVDRGGYLLWRLPRGNYRAGVASLSRRLLGIYDESKPGDMVEYHVVRNGVDECALTGMLDNGFDQVHLLKYWSHQWSLLQRLGERAGVVNSFAIRADGFVPTAHGL